MSQQPEDHCIAHTHIEKKIRFLSWCGKSTRNLWCFVNIDHAAYTLQQGSALRPCALCVEAIVKTLTQEEEAEQ